jgi:4-amino-4-deoxy-L-arabinose transferase-like glycosyltransferase
MTDHAQRSRRISAPLLLACLAVSLLCVAYPIYVIRPFRYQGARELALALAVSRFRPVITIITAVGAILALIAYWRAQPRKWKRVLPAAGAVLAVVLAFLARVNIYELMFNPLIHPSFTAAQDVKLDGAEKVIAVRIGKDARAYPIRVMSYHHVVNDVLGGTAIVATY